MVTPTFNNERYLRECIESVVDQTYDNWEYHIVDDSSTDRTVEVAREYADRDTRITVHAHTERLGVPGNWNRSLQAISPRSKYCKVVHADDWVFPDCILRMVELAEEHPSAGVIGAYRLDDKRVNLDGLSVDTPIFPGSEICRRTLLGEFYVFGSPTSLLIRSDLIRERPRFYDESTLHADTEVCFDLLQSTDFGFVHQVLTYTRRHKGAVTSYSQWLGTSRPSQIKMLRLYGRRYLTSEEYDQRLSFLLRRYARNVLTNIHRARDPRFRRYHLGVIDEIDFTELGGAVSRQLARRVRSWGRENVGVIRSRAD